MIIDTSYFTSGKLYIPNATSNPNITGNAPTATANIANYIDRYEEDLLLHAIGYTNYQALKLALETDSLLVDPVNEKWKDLVNGKVYLFNGESVEWKGLREINGAIKTSVIADYVFYHYLIDDNQHYTTTGIQKEKAKNAEEQSPNLKLTQVWREFIQKYQFGEVRNPVRVYDAGRSYLDYFQTQFNVKRSLYQFLKDNDNYGDYHFRMYENRNRFGI